MGNLGATEILLILLVVLLLFGAKRIPEIARGMGKGIREFKDATNDIKRELTVADQPPRISPPPATTAYTPPQQTYAPPASVPPVGTTATDVPPPAAVPPPDAPGA